MHKESVKRKGMIEDEYEDELEKLIYGNITDDKKITSINNEKITLTGKKENKRNIKFNNKSNVIDDEDEDDIFSSKLDDTQFKF